MTENLTDNLENEAPARSGRGWLIVILVSLLAGGGGFASTYLGLWSPRALLGSVGQEAAPALDFVEVPPLSVTIPGPNPRRVQVGLALEISESGRGRVEHLMPRVIDTATAFLTGIAPEAYDRRGILEIIRAELRTRIMQVVDDGLVKDVLLTEFILK